jgi:uncharacterized protein with GYD domain
LQLFFPFIEINYLFKIIGVNMNTYIMMGNYTTQALSEISGDLTERALQKISDCGGVVKSMYALLGENDLHLTVNFPDTQSAIKASIAINKLTGINFKTFQAITVEEFDKMMTT